MYIYFLQTAQNVSASLSWLIGTVRGGGNGGDIQALNDGADLM